jgi:hypothetical protein
MFSNKAGDEVTEQYTPILIPVHFIRKLRGQNRGDKTSEASRLQHVVRPPSHGRSRISLENAIH